MTNTPNKPPLVGLDLSTLDIPLRYYRGWGLYFSVATESFNCPLLCLYGFSNVKDLEKAADRSLELRGQ